MAHDDALRAHLVHLLDWSDAHATLDDAVEGLPAHMRGVIPPGWDYSAWQLVEHLRVAQQDILDYCIAERYRPMQWPDDYWPSAAAPPSDDAWDDSIAAYRRDRKALQALASNPGIDLFQVVPHGTTQTYLREILLAADHAAYHVAQIVSLRKQLGIWKR